MNNKESSDDPQHVIVNDATLLPRARVRGWRDYLALGLATCGVGLIPLAPGTWGSLVGVLLYLGLRAASVRLYMAARMGGWPVPPKAVLLNTLLLVALVALARAGIWAATRCEQLVR